MALSSDSILTQYCLGFRNKMWKLVSNFWIRVLDYMNNLVYKSFSISNDGLTWREAAERIPGQSASFCSPSRSCACGFWLSPRRRKRQQKPQKESYLGERQVSLTCCVSWISPNQPWHIDLSVSYRGPTPDTQWSITGIVSPEYSYASRQAQGFIPYVTRTSLSQLTTTPPE